MGMRATLILVFVCALAVSGLFFWMAGQEGSPRTSMPEISAPAEPERVVPGGIATLDEVEAPPVESARSLVEQPRPSLEEGNLQQRFAQPKHTDQTTVHGRVVDEHGQPVVGARVRAGSGPFFDLDVEISMFGSPREEATTDAKGSFELDVAHSGTLAFLVRADGFAPFRKADMAIPAGKRTELDDFELERGAILSGLIVDPAGRGVGAAEIVDIGYEKGMLMGLGPMRAPIATTDADGSFRISQLAVGAYRLVIRTEAHPDLTVEGLADDPGVLISGLVWTLEPGAEISGRVLDVPAAERGKLSVVAYRSGKSLMMGERSRRAEVSADGRFRLRGLQPDTFYEVSARRAGTQSGFFTGGSRSERVKARAGDQGITLRYQPEGSVAFQLLDSATQAPIETFQVEAGVGWAQPLRDENGSLKTHHPEGRARFGGLRPSSSEDRVKLVVSAAGYGEYRRDDIALRAGQELDLGQIYLDSVPLLRVTVLTSEGVPIEGARVRLERDMGGSFEIRRTIEISDHDHSDSVEIGDGRSARTNEDGIAELSSYPGDLCKVIARADGFAPATVDGLQLPNVGVTEQVIRMHRGGSALVRVLDSNGNPMVAAKVGHREPTAGGPGPGGMFFGDFGGGMHPTVTDSEGFARFENLTEGVHSFRIQEDRGGGMFFGGGGELVIHGMGGGDADNWRDVQVLENETAELTLTAVPRGSLHGAVLESGTDLAGATLKLKELKDTDETDPMTMAMASFGGGAGITLKSDSKGEFEFDDVKVGRYTLSISHPTRRMSDDYEVQILEGRNSLDIDLPISIIEGRVTDMEGNPLPGLTVKAERPRDPNSPMGRRSVVMMFADEGGGNTIISDGSPALGDSVKTDADGRYSLRGVMPEVELVVRVEGEGVQPGTSREVRLDPDELKRNIDIQLAAGGSILVEVTLADGAPARFVSVTADYLDEDDVEPKRDFVQGGSTTLTGLKPGRWVVRAQRVGPSSGDGPPLEREVLVSPGKTANAALSFD